MPKRILYIQYTNPGGYPPLEHSSQILANAGWQVLFLGTGALGADRLRFPDHPNIRVRRLGFVAAGWRQKVHYLYYLVWVLAWVIHWQPHWLYASDPLICPIALVLSYWPGTRIVYHEHDSPTSELSPSRFMRLIAWFRIRLAKRAELCVLPNERRAEKFVQYTGTARPVVTVWNCPRLNEVAIPKVRSGNQEVRVFYHGSIVPARLPMIVIDALAQLPKQVKLRIVGYETVGAKGYIRQLRDHATSLGLSERVEVFEPVPQRHELLKLCQPCEVGLALLPQNSRDWNEQTMVGASNKPFDYLASGLALLVSDIPEWWHTYVEPGYGLACNPNDVDSIINALRQFIIDCPNECYLRGQKGQQRILDEWNYEQQFQPILRILNGGSNETTRCN